MTINQPRLIASPGAWMEGEALRQFYACSSLDGVRQALGFPDLHPGKGLPVGAAFVTEGLIYPHLIGGDIGCGMTLWQTDLPRRRSRPERWAELPFSLETRWEGNLGGWLQDNNGAWSLAHGAGRKWARSETRLRVRERFRVSQLVQTSLGSRVIREDRDLLYEEAPMAYKPVESVIESLEQAGLIRVIATLRPVLTYKTRSKSGVPAASWRRTPDFDIRP